MQERDRSLLARIEQDLVDGDVTTTALLNKCILLAARTGSDELRVWAMKELSGYSTEDDLPGYRKVMAQIYIDGQAGLNIITGQSIGPGALPPEIRAAGIGNEVPLGFPLGELEALAASAEGARIPLPNSTTIAHMMNERSEDAFQAVHAVYWKIRPETLRGVVDQIRAALTVLIGELVRSLPPGTETPTSGAASQALNLAIAGGGSHTLNLVNNQVSSGGTNTTSTAEPTDGSWWSRWRKRGIVVGIATVLAAVAGVGTWLGWIPFGGSPEPAPTPAVEAPR
jgi:hypothetical protein